MKRFYAEHHRCRASHGATLLNLAWAVPKAKAQSVKTSSERESPDRRSRLSPALRPTMGAGVVQQLTVSLLPASTSIMPRRRFWQSGGMKWGMWNTPSFTFSKRFLRLSSSKGRAPWSSGKTTWSINLGRNVHQWFCWCSSVHKVQLVWSLTFVFAQLTNRERDLKIRDSDKVTSRVLSKKQYKPRYPN